MHWLVASARFLAALTVLLVVSGDAAAQIDPVTSPDPASVGEPIARGTSYNIFAEPGAPTIELVVLGSGIRNGVYRIQRGISLVETLALMGGTAASDSTDRTVTRAFIRVLRNEGGQLQPIYEATTDQLLREVSRHPVLMNGDVIESEIEYETIPEKTTVLEVLQIASRVASLVSAAILLFYRLN